MSLLLDCCAESQTLFLKKLLGWLPSFHSGSVFCVAFLSQPTKHPAALVRILQKVLPQGVAI